MLRNVRVFFGLFGEALAWAFWRAFKMGTALGSGVWLVLGFVLTRRLAKEWGWFEVTISDSAYEPALIALGAFVFLFVVRLTAAPYILWKKERDKNLKILEADDVGYGLDVFGQAEDQMIADGGKLSCHVRLVSKAAKPIEFGPATFLVAFEDGDVKQINGRGQVLRPDQTLSWSVSSNAELKEGDGVIKINADVRYGPIGKERTRRLNKEMVISYKNKSGITVFTGSSDISDSDTAIDRGKVW